MTNYLQSVSFSGTAVITLRWPDFIATVSNKLCSIQYIIRPDGYTVFALDAGMVYTTLLVNPAFDANYPWSDPDYSQAQNYSDFASFVSGYLSTSNQSIESRTADGRTVIRQTIASKSKNYNLRIFSFTAGNPSSLINQDSNFNQLSDITLTCYDGYGNITTNPAVAVKTVVDMEPPYNYEIIGGWIDSPSSILGGTTGEWWISAIGVPDIPASYGGSINFVYPANLELIYTNQIVSNGRASQYLTYNPSYHTNKIRWIVKHPSNNSLLFQMYVEIFV